MANPWARDRATGFYLAFALVGLTVVALGFGVTYVVPMARRTFSAPWFVHLHGAFASGWIVLLIVQSSLVMTRRTPLHRRLGQAALPLALTIWASGIATAVWAAARDLPRTWNGCHVKPGRNGKRPHSLPFAGRRRDCDAP